MTQKQALDILKTGHNVFLTGPPGSGKTYLLNQYIDYLKKNKVNVAVTASTGVASTHIVGGRTVHSWSGIGIKEKLAKKDLKSILEKNYLVDRIRKVSVLIVDEISMLHDYQFDMVDRICREVRVSIQPFGGLQIICSGDFFQLPPVQNRATRKSRFVTESYIWPDADIKVCYLTEQHRHIADENLTRLLNDIRGRSVTEYTVKILLSRKNKEVNSKIKPTKLFTHNENVDVINQLELNKINEEEHSYLMGSEGEKKLVKILKKSCLAPETLVLKEGTEVMFLKNNFDKGYVNGTRGKVIGFNGDNYPIVETFDGQIITAMPARWIIEENGVTNASISQIPLRLAWAITVHKSQGMTLDTAEIDLSKAFEKGMGYVALSRVKKLTGLKLQGFNETALEVGDKAVELDKEFSASSKDNEKVFVKINPSKKRRLHKEFLNKNKNNIIEESDEDYFVEDLPF